MVRVPLRQLGDCRIEMLGRVWFEGGIQVLKRDGGVMVVKGFVLRIHGMFDLLVHFFDERSVSPRPFSPILLTLDSS